MSLSLELIRATLISAVLMIFFIRCCIFLAVGSTLGYDLALTGKPTRYKSIIWISKRWFGIPFLVFWPQGVFWMGSNTDTENAVAQYLYSKNKTDYHRISREELDIYLRHKRFNPNLRVWPSKEIAEGLGVTGPDDWYPDKYINIIN